jgi:hypothetical protein
MLWISAITMATRQKYNELQDPTYSYKLDTRNFDASNSGWLLISAIINLSLHGATN